MLQIDPEKILNDPSLIDEFGQEKLEKFLSLLEDLQQKGEVDEMSDIANEKKKMNVRNRLVRKKIHKLKKLETVFDKKCELVRNLINQIEQGNVESHENLLNELKSFDEAQENLREEFSHMKFDAHASENIHEGHEEGNIEGSDYEENNSLYDQWKHEFSLLKSEMQKILKERDELLEAIKYEQQKYQELENKYFEFEQSSIKEQETLVQQIESLKSSKEDLQKQMETLKKENTNLQEQSVVQRDQSLEHKEQVIKLKPERESGGDISEHFEKASQKQFAESKFEDTEIENKLATKEAELVKIREEKASLEAAFSLLKLEYETQMISLQVLKPELEEFYELICTEITERKRIPFSDFVTKESFRMSLIHLKEEFKMVTNKLIELRTSNADLSKRLQQSNEELGARVVELNETKTRLLEAENERERLGEELLLAQSELDLAREKYVQEQNVVKKQGECIEKLGQQLPYLTAELEASKSELAQAQEKLLFQEKLSEDLMKKDTKNSEYQNTLEQQIERFEGIVKELKVALEQKESTVEGLREELSELQKEKEAQIKELEKHLEFKNADIQRLSQQIETVETTIAHNETFIFELRTQNQDYSRQIRNLEEEKGRLEFQLHESNMYISELKNNIERYLSKIMELEGIIAEEKQKYAAKTGEHEMLVNKFKSLQPVVTQMKIEITKATDEKANLEQIIYNTKKNLAAFRLEAQESKKVANRMQDTLEALEMNLNILDKTSLTNKTETKVSVELPIESEIAEVIKTYETHSNPRSSTIKPLDNYHFSWNEHLHLQQMLKETAKKFEKNENSKSIDKWRSSGKIEEDKMTGKKLGGENFDQESSVVKLD